MRVSGRGLHTPARSKAAGVETLRNIRVRTGDIFMFYRYRTAPVACVSFLLFIFIGMEAQGSEVRGKVIFRNNGATINGVEVSLSPLGLTVTTNNDGNYSFPNVPPGVYEVSGHLHTLAGESLKIEVVDGEDTVADLQLMFFSRTETITVTASGREIPLFDAFQSVSTLNSLELSRQSSFGLGDIVDKEPGVHKRGFGPGSSRPVVRGFDGDRVLVLSDGLPTGTLSSQSGEHAEPVDSVNMDRVEIVKGPATLLYGSNAIGGVVNLVSAHHLLHESPHPGLRGQFTTVGGTNDNQAAVHGNTEYGYKNWLVWASGSRNVASDYRSPEGRVDNSKTRMTSASLGFGWFGRQPFFNMGYSFNTGRLGIPFAGDFHRHEEEENEHGHNGRDHGGHDLEENEYTRVDESFMRQDVRFNTGARDLDFVFNEIRLSANFSRWIHRELEKEETATSFDNKLFNIRTTLTQHPYKALTGVIGFQVFHRDYVAEGEEALSPPITGNGVALFTLQEIDLESARLQFGARIDHARYNPNGLPSRAFIGLSGAAGVHAPLRENTAFIANFTHSHRAPAMEELYNYGPHIGNLAFEIGNTGLKREQANGVDISLRHRNVRVNAEANFYYYSIQDFVYLRLTGETEHGLNVAVFSQDNARFLGGEALLDMELRPELWFSVSLDRVSAELTATGIPLPRIPPMRGKLGLDARWREFIFKPEIVLAAAQDNVYPTEARTARYVTVDFNASYMLARGHVLHVFSLNVSNIGNRLYRNHLSFIKDLAPEPGRGLRFSYSLRLF